MAKLRKSPLSCNFFAYLCRMEFRTIVGVEPPEWRVKPFARVLLVGSCFAQNMGGQFSDARFPTVVNPFGVMYNPASVLHTVRDWQGEADVALITLGTNRVYVERATGCIVDNCQKRPQQLFREVALSVEQSVGYLEEALEVLQRHNPLVRVVITVSPIRYRKYGYHGSQLSKATLLLAADQLARRHEEVVSYFPAYEILNDELRDYRFYASDMLHPSEQAVDYLWERFVEAYFSDDARRWLREWSPVRAALGHRPLHPDTPEWQAFKEKTQAQYEALRKKWGLAE